MKKTLIIAMACYGLCVKAQTTGPTNKIYFYNDSVSTTKQISLRIDGFDNVYLKTDRLRVPASKVQFFESEDGFFANIKMLNYGNRSEFVERIEEGRINLYDQYVCEPYFGSRLNQNGFSQHYQRPVTEIVYFNKNFGPLMRVNYPNLSRELQANKLSMDMLKGYRKSRNTTIILFSAAAAAIITGGISFLKVGSENSDFSNRGFGMSSFKKDNFTPSYILLGIGAGFSFGGALTLLKSKEKLLGAMEVYNR